MSKEVKKSKQVKKLSDAFELTEDGKVVIKDAELYEAIRQAEGQEGGEEGMNTDGVGVGVIVNIS